MLRREGDYLIYQDLQKYSDENRQEIQKQHHQLYAQGNLSEKLAAIKLRMEQIKKERQNEVKKINTKILSSLISQNEFEGIGGELNILIPEQILLLERKIQKIEEKLQPNQIMRQKFDKKGTIVERIKKLQKKLEDLIKNKSIQITINNIQLYSTHIEEKEENMKQLFLHQILNKTQGMKQQIQVLERYLDSINSVQLILKSSVPLPKLIEDHNEVIRKKIDLSIRVEKLFEKMKNEYIKLLEAINSIDI